VKARRSFRPSGLAGVHVAVAPALNLIGILLAYLSLAFLVPTATALV
jgi:hypothetical protein